MLRNRVLLAFALVLSFVLQAHAQALPRASAPENVGLSSARLGRLSTAIQAGVDRSEIPGAVIIVARKGKVAYLESFGFRDREASSRMPQNAIHRIASMTKPITTVGFMTLVEEGKVSLADPVAQYLPELKDVKVGIEKKDDSGGVQLVLAMVSTAPDYARFCQFLLNGGKLDGVRLLSRKTVEYMASDHLPRASA